ncbi:MAG: pyridoxal phosphate-dependent aminotransferase [Methanomassiliicoccales archaeon]|nr:pyridoxal phosphate-dependent aminotransferase [Methanomassiliicoccales archaeon]
MKFEPFLLEEWLIRCLGAKIDLDHSGAPNPLRDGFDPCVGGEAFLNEFEVEEKLYKAISSAYRVKRENIALTCGAQSANFTFFQSCLERGDKVAVESPTYAPIRACANAMFKSVLPVDRKRQAGYAVDPASFKAALRKGAKAVALTNLHNPSAKMLSDESLTQLLEQAGAKGALVIVDEVYREMAHGRPPKGAFELGANGVATNGLSKLWGLGGLRIGWLIGPKEIATMVTEARLYSSWHLPTRAMALAVHAIKKKEWFRKRVLEVARRNLPVIRDWATEERRVELVEPDGCLHLLLRLPPGTDDERFSERLLKRHRTAVCPGRYFGEAGSVRVTFSCESDDLSKGLGQISDTLDRL